MRTIALFLALIAIVFAQQKPERGSSSTEKSSSSSSKVSWLPERMDKFAGKFEGTLKLELPNVKKTIPVSGELYYRHLGKNWYHFDKIMFEHEGKQLKSLRWVTLENDVKKTMNIEVDNKCIHTVFSKDKGTLPEFSDWKKTSENHFEQTVSFTGKLCDLFPGIKGVDEKEHRLQSKFVITMKNKKPTEFECTLTVDGKEIAVKRVRVTEEIRNPDFEKVLAVPKICKARTELAKEDLSWERIIIGVPKIILSSKAKSSSSQRSE
jgi:hypothetical protein